VRPTGRHRAHELDTIEADVPGSPSAWKATCACGFEVMAVAPQRHALRLLGEHIAEVALALLARVDAAGVE
jgi:hypothetical protein